MPSADFTRIFISYCNYLTKYEADFSVMTYHLYTGLKSLISTDGITTLTTALTIDKLQLSNISKDTFNLFVYFNENLLNSSTPFNIEHKKDYINVCKLLVHLIGDGFKVVKGNVYEMTIDNTNLLICVKERLDLLLENSSNQILVNYQLELELLKKKLESIQNSNSTPSDTAIVDKFENLPDSFEKSKRLIYQELEKKLINDNHITNFKIHLEKKTVPSSLFFDKFPKPFLPCDKSYVDSFNILICEFQVKALNLAILSCETKITGIISNLTKIKSKYTQVADIESIFKDIEEQAAENNQDRFRKSATKINSYVPRAYNVKPSTQQSSNNNDSRTRNRKRLNFDFSHNSDNTSYNNTYNNRNKRMHFNNNSNKTVGYNQRGRGNLNNNNHSQRQPNISHESQLSPNNNVPTSTNRYTRN